MILKNEEERVLVKIWDWETRVLHWCNVLLILALMALAVSSEILKDFHVGKHFRHQLMDYHVYIGYALIVTVILRVLWGFGGNEYARWRDLWPFTAEKIGYIAHKLKWHARGFKKGPAKFRYMGHDPLGALFYLALFLVVVLQILTGLSLAGIEKHMAPWQGFFAGFTKGTLSLIKDGAGEIHEFGFDFMIFFIISHVGAVVIHELHEKTGLLSSMINGVKFIPEDKFRAFKDRIKR